MKKENDLASVVLKPPSLDKKREEVDEYSPTSPLDWIANEIAKWEVKRIRKKVDKRVREQFSHQMDIIEQTENLSLESGFVNCSVLRRSLEFSGESAGDCFKPASMREK